MPVCMAIVIGACTSINSSEASAGRAARISRIRRTIFSISKRSSEGSVAGSLSTGGLSSSVAGAASRSTVTALGAGAVIPGSSTPSPRSSLSTLSRSALAFSKRGSCSQPSCKPAVSVSCCLIRNSLCSNSFFLLLSRLRRAVSMLWTVPRPLSPMLAGKGLIYPQSSRISTVIKLGKLGNMSSAAE